MPAGSERTPEGVMRKLVLVTGSRAFDGHTSTPIVQERIRWIVHSLDPTSDVVLNGGDVGPDRWSSEKAKAYGVKRVELHANGQRYENDRHVGSWTNAPRQELDRNFALVESAARAKEAGWDVSVHGFVAPWSETNGTRHTLELARKRGLRVEERTVEQPETANIAVVRPDVVWIDIETGGISPKQHPIIEIAAVHSDPSSMGVIRTFETKVAVPQGFFVEAQAANVNGYNPLSWRGAPSITEALTSFHAWLPSKFIPGGYNFNFDRRFLEHWFQRENVPMPGWHAQEIDPLPTARSTLKKQGYIDSAKLDVLCYYFGIYNEVRHRALADAERARLVYLAFLGKTPTNSVFDKEMAG
jgi:DNA polymerase III epsilon subunit-like protein